MLPGFIAWQCQNKFKVQGLIVVNCNRDTVSVDKMFTFYYQMVKAYQTIRVVIIGHPRDPKQKGL